MRWSREFIESVEQATDLVQVISERGVVLQSAGTNYKGLCPFHSEKTPSFNVNPQRGFFYCFGCHVGGNAIKFLMQYDNLSFVEAVTELANRFGVPIEAQSGEASAQNAEANLALQALEKASHFYHQCLTHPQGGQGVQHYLEQRRIPQEMWTQFQIGFAPDAWQSLIEHLQPHRINPQLLNQVGLSKTAKSGRAYDYFRNRLIFPIRDHRGRCIAFGGRTLDDEQQPKYLNSPDSKYYRKSQVLYGFYEGLSTIKQQRHLIVVEGYLDVIRLHEYGFTNAVASCGTALTAEHIRFMQRYVDKVTLLFDGDAAGQKAALKGCQLFLPHSIETAIVTLPPGEDPDTFLLSQGAEAFEHLLKNSASLLHYWTQQTLQNYPPTPQGRTQALHAMTPFVQSIQKEELRQMTLLHLAELLHLPPQTVFQLHKQESLPSTQNRAKVENFNPPASEEDGKNEERWILKTLLTDRSLLTMARQQLVPGEFHNPRYQQVYQQFLQLSDEAFQTISIENFQNTAPELHTEMMGLYLESIPPEHIDQQFKRALYRLKSRNLKQQYEMQCLQADPMEILKAGVELRKQQEALNQLLQCSMTS